MPGPARRFPQSTQLGVGVLLSSLQMRKLSLGEVKQNVRGPPTGEPGFELSLSWGGLTQPQS